MWIKSCHGNPARKQFAGGSRGLAPYLMTLQDAFEYIVAALLHDDLVCANGGLFTFYNRPDCSLDIAKPQNPNPKWLA